MLRTVEGMYKNGKIDVSEIPENVPDCTRVIVTFLEPAGIDLRTIGIDKVQAAGSGCGYALQVIDVC